jgi:Fe-S-cluster containining protein
VTPRVLLPIYGGTDAGARPATRAAVHDAIRGGVDAEVVADRVARAVDDMFEAVAIRASDEPRPACARGCSYCCHQRVELTSPEVHLLARALDAIDEPARSPLLARLDATAARLAGLSSRAYHLAQVPCALLDEEGACTVYAARPIACRRAHSTDASACASVHEDPTLDIRIPDAPSLTWNLSAIVLGYFEGLAHAGAPPHQYELHAALKIALAERDPNVADPFAPARTRSADELGAPR